MRMARCRRRTGRIVGGTRRVMPSAGARAAMPEAHGAMLPFAGRGYGGAA
jgi:hypothetical protein